MGNQQKVTQMALLLGIKSLRNGFSLVYVLPGIDFSQYHRILLDDAYIAFRKNWQKEKNESGENKVSANDMAQIKIELGRLFRDTFSTTLEDNDYILTTEFDDDVLQIKPAIINLDIMAPATENDSQSLSYSAMEHFLSLPKRHLKKITIGQDQIHFFTHCHLKRLLKSTHMKI